VSLTRAGKFHVTLVMNVADVRKAERLFGYRPRVPFEDGIRRFGEWFLRERTSERGARHVA
jgi:nucleoside-diphosphate-sugar epimerase